MNHPPLWLRFRRLFGADPAADVNDELRFHIESKADDLVAQGWTREAARREAERQFGDFAAVREAGEKMSKEREVHRRRRDYWGAFRQDFRYALRTLAKDRSFSIAAVLILALGIAANTAVFSVVNTLLLRPLPFPEANRLTWLMSGKNISSLEREAAGLSSVTYTADVYEELQRQNRSFQSISSYDPFFGDTEFTIAGRGEPQAVAGVQVSQGFFQTLGVQPSLGRLFAPEECRKGGRPAVLLSDGFWRRQYAADPGIIGQIVVMNKRPVTVIGVLPSDFDFGSVFAPGSRFDVFVPAVMDDLRNDGNTLALVGRLRPGVSARAAEAELSVLVPHIMAAHRDWWGDYGTEVSALQDHVTGMLRRSLIVLWCAVGLILLIVCVNLSNLLLVRGTARSKEFAMRAALGAGRGRLIRQMMAESLVLASAGGITGLGLAFALTSWLARQGSIALPLLSSVRVDGAALGWTLLVGVMAALLFGTVPSVRLSAGNVQDVLKDSGHGLTGGRRHDRLRGALVVSEVALACVLLIGAGLLLRSFLNVMDMDVGFRPAQAATMKIDYDASGDGAHRGAVTHEILRNIAAIPGIQSAGIVDMLPLGRNRSWGLQAKGRVYPKDATIATFVRIVTPGYLPAMGMRLKSGRDFEWRDATSGERVVIINEAAARVHWPGEDPVGRIALADGDGGNKDTRVIGVIGDVREAALETAIQPEMYLPVWQAGPEGAQLVVRSTLPPEALSRPVMRTLRSLNPAQPATELQPLERIVDSSASPRRFFALLVGSFAGLGLALAALGIYGVIAYSVARQTQEIGIRMALGAPAQRVQREVIGGALRLALSGIGLGVVAALAAARAIASLLYGTRPEDPVTFAGIVLLLALVALVAGYIPARRASRVDPATALRTT